MDVTALRFATGAFAPAVASLLICVLSDEQQAPAPREPGRVVNLGGVITLLGYVRPTGMLQRLTTRGWQPWITRAYGVNFDRHTEQHAASAGLAIIESRCLVDDLLELLTLRATAAVAG